MKKILALILTFLLCISVVTACGKKPPKLTEAEIKTAIESTEGELSIEGDSEDVTAFTFIVKGVNVTNLTNKSFTRNAVKTLLSNPGSITYAQLKTTTAFSAVMQIDSLLTKLEASEDEETEEDPFDSEAYIDEILTVICDGTTRDYTYWSLCATTDKTNDSIVIKAQRK